MSNMLTIDLDQASDVALIIAMNGILLEQAKRVMTRATS